MFEPQKGKRYDMPAAFGPSIYPEATEVPEATLISIPFVTTSEAAARLMPRAFKPAEKPVIYVNRIRYRGVDYLGGRGYEEVLIAVNARYECSGERIEAPYIAALWVSECAAILGGREFMGHPKIYGEIPPIVDTDKGHSFEVAEFGNGILSASLSELKSLSDETLARIREKQTPFSFGWKYIAGPGGTVDVDHPTLLKTVWNYRKAWVGKGTVTFMSRSQQETPTSWQIVNILAKLPIVDRMPAFMATGTATIDRAATRKLQTIRE